MDLQERLSVPKSSLHFGYPLYEIYLVCGCVVFSQPDRRGLNALTFPFLVPFCSNLLVPDLNPGAALPSASDSLYSLRFAQSLRPLGHHFSYVVGVLPSRAFRKRGMSFNPSGLFPTLKKLVPFFDHHLTRFIFES